MTSLADRFADDITLEYSLIDRMRVRGHVMNLQNVGMLGAFFKRCRGVSWIEPRDLQKLTDDFVQSRRRPWPRRTTSRLLAAKPGESHVDQAAAFWPTWPTATEAIYCIIKVQEEASSFVSYVPKKEPDSERKIARGRRRVNHYYFFIKDRRVWRRQLHPHQQLRAVSRHRLLQRPSLRGPATANRERRLPDAGQPVCRS